MPISASTPREALRALIADVLSDPSSAFGYAVTEIAFGEAVEITLEKERARFIVWLRPASDATQCYKHTARLKIGHIPDPPDRLGYALMDTVVARIEVWERSLPDDAHSRLFDPRAVSTANHPDTSDSPERHPGSKPTREWLAVRAGLKPACRNLVDADTAEQLIEAARASGLHARVTEADAFVGGFCSGAAAEGTTILVHVARTAAAAAAAASAERAMIDVCGRGQRVTDAQVRALGAALGYPPCCVEAFLPVRDLAPPEIKFHALQQTPGPASFLLNNVVEQRSLISHCVCRYDCAASVRYAQALLAEVARLDRAAADELEASLRGLVVMFRQEGALRLVLAGLPETGDAYRFSGVDALGGGDRFDQWQVALRGADALEMRDRMALIVRGANEMVRLDAPPDEVQIRLFA